MNRRGRNRLTPSFFPFISVLIAIIGSLIFMTLTMTLTALDPMLVIESPMEWVPDEDGVGGSNRRRSNIIIECADDQAVLLATESGEVVEKIKFDTGLERRHLVGIYRKLRKGDPDAWTGTPFFDLAKEVGETRATSFITFLLRPSGIQAYTTLSDILKMRNSIEFDEVKYPDIEERWDADWSLVYVEEDREVVSR